MPSTRPATCATLNHSTPDRPSGPITSQMQVSAIVTDTVLARYWLVWSPTCRRLATPKSRPVLKAPTMPNLVSSWTSIRQRWYRLITAVIRSSPTGSRADLRAGNDAIATGLLEVNGSPTLAQSLWANRSSGSRIGIGHSAILPSAWQVPHRDSIRHVAADRRATGSARSHPACHHDPVDVEDDPEGPSGGQQPIVEALLRAVQGDVQHQVIRGLRVGRVLTVGAPVGGHPRVGELVDVDPVGEVRHQVVGGRHPRPGGYQLQRVAHHLVSRLGHRPDARVVLPAERRGRPDHIGRQ